MDSFLSYSKLSRSTPAIIFETGQTAPVTESKRIELRKSCRKEAGERRSLGSKVLKIALANLLLSIHSDDRTEQLDLNNPEDLKPQPKR